MEFIDTWKNKTVFLKQLDLNKKELDGNYPPHWISFIDIVNSMNTNINLLDIGCGVGSYYELCRRHCKNVNYMGMDYSADAVEIARNQWECDQFIVLDVNDLTQNFLSNYNMIHMGALLDILPNADDTLKFILGFGVEYIFISRIEVSTQTECSTYTAYDEITTYKYKHCRDTLLNIISDNGYTVFKSSGSNILLKKI